MNFYQSIAEYYEQIFPLNKKQIDFVENCFENDSKDSILDIGCGTGSLSIELTKLFSKVSAIDLDEAMIEKAIAKNNKYISFQKLNMLNIDKEYGQNAFDGIVCFGNTLVHLDGYDQVLDFFKQAKSVLKKNGNFLFQIINYDRIIDHQIDGLPTIENDLIKFSRNYYYTKEKNRIDFETILTIKETGQIIENTVKLFPVRKFEIAHLLKKAGFTNVHYFGSFGQNPYKMESIPLVVKAH